MASPHPALLAVARGEAGIEVSDRDGEAFLRSAVEHRMTGLAQSAVLASHLRLPRAAADALIELDMQAWGRHTLLCDGLRIVSSRLSVAGVRWMAFKGPVTERLLYDRPGERPFFDIDIAIAPEHLDDVDSIVELLQPDHPGLGSLSVLSRNGHIQAVSLRLDGDGIPVDLHVDPLSLGIPAPSLGEMWERCRLVEVQPGLQVPALTDEAALIHAAVNITRDRFRHLLGLVDVSRFSQRAGLDQRDVADLATRMQLSGIVTMALEAVGEELDVRWPESLAGPGKWERAAWEWTWGGRSRLGGVTSRMSRVQRSRAVLPLLVVGPGRAWLRWMVRRPFPPREVVRAVHGEGPYLRTLAGGRLQVWRWRRAARKA